VNGIKYIRAQVTEEDGNQHTVVEFTNGSRACSCGLVRGNLPSLVEEPSQEFLQAMVAAEEDRLRAEGWEACVEFIRRRYNGWLMPEDTWFLGNRHNPYRSKDT
jgi:hypothetical protein